MKKILLILGGVLFFVFTAQAGWFSSRQLNFSGDKIITLNDDGYFHEQIVTSATTVKDFFNEQKLEIEEEDVFFPPAEAKIFPGMIINVRRAIPIKIIVDGGRIEKKVLADNIKEALGESGVTLSHLDKVSPAINSPLVAGAKIEVTRIEVEEKIEKKELKFKIIEKKDKNLAWRKKKVKQKGEKGVEEIKYKITYKDGKQVSKKKLSGKITKKPIDEIVVTGTKIKVGKSKVGIASWYAYTGTMACASRMFPRGTWLRVTNKENGRQVFVVVNDYGPQQGTGKIIDLDKVAFQKIAPIGKGVVKVKVEEIL